MWDLLRLYGAADDENFYVGLDIEDRLQGGISVDQGAILNNNISITPIQFDLTNYGMIEKLRQWDIKV